MQCPNIEDQFSSCLWRCRSISHNLIQALRSTETCRPSTNDENVNIAAIDMSDNVGLLYLRRRGRKSIYLHVCHICSSLDLKMENMCSVSNAQ
jgi:hypothetical protein